MTRSSAELSDVLRQNGYRLTASRQAILQALVNCGGHISADGLVDRVRKESQKIGRMTVYRTLDILSQLGLIRAVYQGSGAAHYVLMEDGHHHHLTCTSCGLVIEVQECELKSLEQMMSSRFNFRVAGHLLEIYGKCEACQG